MIQFDHDGPYLSEVITDDGRVPLAPFLAESDIVVNCTLQDPNRPLLYLKTADLAAFRPGSLIVDVSCDEGMGFDWARPTSFADPMFTVGGSINYYAVDHSPSYLWNSASWEISEALLGVPARSSWRVRTRGQATTRSPARSRSATARCAIRRSSSSRTAPPTGRTRCAPARGGSPDASPSSFHRSASPGPTGMTSAATSGPKSMPASAPMSAIGTWNVRNAPRRAIARAVSPRSINRV